MGGSIPRGLDGVPSGRPEAFGTKPDQRLIEAQYENEWYKTVKQKAGFFMVNSMAPKGVRAELRHVVVCQNVTGRNKEGVVQSKRAPVGLLITVD